MPPHIAHTIHQGAPKEGLPIIGPYTDFLDQEGQKSEEKSNDDEKIPVGSLRFLRNQAEMESDMNSRRVIAGRQMTGDSGILSEVHTCCLSLYSSYCNIIWQPSHIWNSMQYIVLHSVTLYYTHR